MVPSRYFETGFTTPAELANIDTGFGIHGNAQFMRGGISGLVDLLQVSENGLGLL